MVFHHGVMNSHPEEEINRMMLHKISWFRYCKSVNTVYCTRMPDHGPEQLDHGEKRHQWKSLQLPLQSQPSAAASVPTTNRGQARVGYIYSLRSWRQQRAWHFYAEGVTLCHHNQQHYEWGGLAGACCSPRSRLWQWSWGDRRLLSTSHYDWLRGWFMPLNH